MSKSDFEQGNNILRKKIESKGELKTSIEYIWDYAKRNIHPTIRGNSGQDQGYKHALSVENNIGNLFAEVETKKIKPKVSPEMAYILSASAALHDIGKCVLAEEILQKNSIPDCGDHGENGANVLEIEEMYSLIGLYQEPFRKAVASIVMVHSNGDINSIGEDKDKHFLGDIKFVYLMSLSALFRLADMLDTDFNRVPYIYNSVLEENPSRTEDEVLNARSKIWGWSLNKDNTKYIRINAETSSNDIVKNYVERSLNGAITNSQELNLASFQDGETTVRFPSKFQL